MQTSKYKLDLPSQLMTPLEYLYRPLFFDPDGVPMHTEYKEEIPEGNHSEDRQSHKKRSSVNAKNVGRPTRSSLLRERTALMKQLIREEEEAKRKQAEEEEKEEVLERKKITAPKPQQRPKRHSLIMDRSVSPETKAARLRKDYNVKRASLTLSEEKLRDNSFRRYDEKLAAAVANLAQGSPDYPSKRRDSLSKTASRVPHKVADGDNSSAPLPKTNKAAELRRRSCSSEKTPIKEKKAKRKKKEAVLYSPPRDLDPSTDGIKGPREEDSSSEDMTTNASSPIRPTIPHEDVVPIENNIQKESKPVEWILLTPIRSGERKALLSPVKEEEEVGGTPVDSFDSVDSFHEEFFEDEVESVTLNAVIPSSQVDQPCVAKGEVSVLEDSSITEEESVAEKEVSIKTAGDRLAPEPPHTRPSQVRGASSDPVFRKEPADTCPTNTNSSPTPPVHSGISADRTRLPSVELSPQLYSLDQLRQHLRDVCLSVRKMLDNDAEMQKSAENTMERGPEKLPTPVIDFEGKSPTRPTTPLPSSLDGCLGSPLGAIAGMTWSFEPADISNYNTASVTPSAEAAEMAELFGSPPVEEAAHRIRYVHRDW